MLNNISSSYAGSLDRLGIAKGAESQDKAKQVARCPDPGSTDQIFPNTT